MGRRVALLLLLTTVGYGFAVIADATCCSLQVNAGDAVAGWFFSPMLTFFGGLTHTPHAAQFELLGFLFWPVWLVLARFWVKQPRVLLGATIVVWSFVGVFQPIHRFDAMMSV